MPLLGNTSTTTYHLHKNSKKLMSFEDLMKLIFLSIFVFCNWQACVHLHVYVPLSPISSIIYESLLLYIIPRAPPPCHIIKYEKESVSLEGRKVTLGCPKVLECDAGASGLHPSLTKEAWGHSQRGFSVHIGSCVIVCACELLCFCCVRNPANLSSIWKDVCRT